MIFKVESMMLGNIRRKNMYADFLMMSHKSLMRNKVAFVFFFCLFVFISCLLEIRLFAEHGLLGICHSVLLQQEQEVKTFSCLQPFSCSTVQGSSYEVVMKLSCSWLQEVKSRLHRRAARARLLPR